jgi:hypothetical protein
MYIKSYKNCKHCNKEIVSSRLKSHEGVCLAQQAKAKLPKQKRGRPFGAIAWNKGLTKETSEIVKRNSDSMAKTTRQKVKDGTYVVSRMGEEARIRTSKRMTKHNPGGKCKWYEVNGIKVQGRWERDFAIYLNTQTIRWQRPKYLKYVKEGTVRRYTPDFYLPDKNLYIEIKGRWWGDDRNKMNLVISQHQDKKFLIIEDTNFSNYAL